MSRRKHLFVADVGGAAPSGGTLYNTRLLDALRSRGEDVALARRPAPEHAELDDNFNRPQCAVWVDSLYLEQVPVLRRRFSRAELWLILHYLPSQLESDNTRVSPIERAALELADGVLVPSPFMAGVVGRTGISCRCLSIEPGVDVGPTTRAKTADPPRIAMLSHVLPHKGLLGLLEALADATAVADRFELDVVGRLDVERTHATLCAAVLARAPRLHGRVRLIGGRRPAEARAILGASDLFVSASTFEAYGMALSEARATGVPILALPGGNAETFVDADNGGELARSVPELAERLLALVRRPSELARRKRLALASRRARSWDDAAVQWLEGVG